jgi:hypothetical protein
MSFPWTIEIPEEKYWELKAILEEERGKEFDIEDVREIADSLVELHLSLSRNQAEINTKLKSA